MPAGRQLTDLAHGDRGAGGADDARHTGRPGRFAARRGGCAGSSRWHRGRRARMVDAVVAILVAMIQVFGTWGASSHQVAPRHYDVAGALLIAAAGMILWVRRRWPDAVLIGVLATTFAFSALGYPNGPIWLSLIIAFGTVVFRGHRRVALAVLVGGYVAFLWLSPWLSGQPGPSIAAAFGLAAWLLVLYFVAEAIRLRAERIGEMRHRRAEETRRRVVDERLRIARELHDVVAHNISLINVQASTTLHLLGEATDAAPAGDDRARAALATIKQVSQETLVELRSVLGALRRVDEEAPRAPAPSVERLDELVERANAARVDTSVAIEGTPRPLAPAADLAAYRIIQEAVTNVVRHAHAETCGIRLTYRPDGVVVQVDDDGPGPVAAVDAGNGITGMTERAVALGGTLQAGPRRPHGFRVRAWLPTNTIERATGGTPGGESSRVPDGGAATPADGEAT